MARYSKINSFNALKTLTVGSKSYQIYSLPRAAQSLGNIDQLPKSLKVLLENLLRFEDQKSVKVLRPRNSIPSSSCTDAGFYRCTSSC